MTTSRLAVEANPCVAPCRRVLKLPAADPAAMPPSFAIWRFIAGILVFCLLSSASARAASVELEWDPNTEADIVGYQLSYGTSTGTHGTTLPRTTATTTTVDGLTPGTRYYFVVRAVNRAGLVSSPSNELTYTPPSDPTPVNHPPVATSRSANTSENTPVAIALTATDADSDPLAWQIVTPPAKGTLSGTAPNLTYTPNANTTGSDSFTFRVNDGKADSNLATVTVSIAAANRLPVATSRSASTSENTPVAIALTATDADSDPLTWQIVTPPAIGTLSGTAPNLTYTPNTNTSGSDSFTFRVNDGKADSNLATVTVSVTPAPLTGNLLARDGWKIHSFSSEESDTPASQAIDGNPASFWHTRWKTDAAPPPHDIQIDLGTFQRIEGFRYLPRQDGFRIGNIAEYEFHTSLDGLDWGSPAASGEFANTPTEKQVSIVPRNARFIRLIAHSEANGSMHAAIAELNLLGGPVINESPKASAMALITRKGNDLPITLHAEDFDGDPLTFRIVGGPLHGALVGTAPELTYQPKPGFTGSDEFRYVVSDGIIDSDPATVSIEVLPATPPPPTNRPPKFASQRLAGPSGKEKQALPAYSVAPSAVDPDAGDQLTFSKVSGPVWLMVQADGSLSGTPAAGARGTHSARIQVTDPAGARDEAVVQIIVAAADVPVPTNRPPTFAANPVKSRSGNEASPLPSFSLATVATDPDPGDVLTFTKVAGADWLQVAADGTVTGTPTVGSRGTQSCRVRAFDQAGAFAETTLLVQVGGPNLPRPWDLAALGRKALAKRIEFEKGVFDLVSAGRLAGSADSGTFAWQPLSGDGQIIAKISSVRNGDTSSRAGVMIRQSLDVSSPHVFLGLDGHGKLRWQQRSRSGTAQQQVRQSKSTPANTQWLRLVRQGDTVTAYQSGNGRTWVKIGSTGVKLGRQAHVGLVVSSGNKPATRAVFRNVKVNP